VELGTAIAEVQQAGGGRTRIEGSGILLLRAMCRLTHMGHKEYAKGDGRRFNDYLAKEYPHLKSRCVGRAEMSKRQDWCTEVSWNFFNLIKPILTFTVLQPVGKEKDMKELNDFTTRADVLRYTEELQKQLGLFGDGILTSLERTIGKYLQNTLGELRNELKEDWMREEVAKLLCTNNNPAERPFAVAKAFLNLYCRMKLSTLANFTLSVCNGSHRMPEPKGKTKKTQNRSTIKARVAITSDPRLQAAVTRLCAVRQVNGGAITTLLKTANKREMQLANGLRIANEEQEKAKMAKKHTDKVSPLT
jgi:hypothetical protein